MDFEPTVVHYENLLRNHNCGFIKAIIPFNQLKTEYNQFEMKKKLFNLYDVFLVDGRISGHVAKVLGKKFSSKKKTPIPIRMEKPNLEERIKKALGKTTMRLSDYGTHTTLQVGSGSMTDSQVAENIVAVCDYLSKNFPGGEENIRNLAIKTPLGPSVPLYVSLGKQNIKLNYQTKLFNFT